MQSTGIDALIRPKPGATPIASYGKDEWVRILSHVMDQLGEFLTLPLHHEQPVEDHVNGGFCLHIWSPEALLGPVELTWKGILGATILDEPEHVHVSACLFLYSRTRKLTTKDGHSYLELEYGLSDTGAGAWRVVDWFDDEYGEFTLFDEVDSAETRERDGFI